MHPISEIYFEYLRHLNRGNPRYVLPDGSHHGNTEGYIRCSDLGRCPLANALEIAGEKPVYPNLLVENDLSVLHLMQQGSRDAEPLQEAFVWKFGNHDPMEPMVIGAVAEKELRDDELKLIGHVDLIYRDSALGEVSLIEIKRRDAPWNKDTPQPKITDLYQMLAYGLISGITRMDLVLINRYFITVWAVVKEAGRYYLESESGERFEYSVSDSELIDEFHRQKSYLRGRRDTPMPDFMNEPEGWQCWHRVESPKNPKKGDAKPGIGKPRCAFFCHQGLLNAEDRFEYTKDDDGRMEPKVKF